MGSEKSAGLSLLLLFFLLYVADSYPNNDLPNSKITVNSCWNVNVMWAYQYAPYAQTVHGDFDIGSHAGSVTQAVHDR